VHGKGRSAFFPPASLTFASFLLIHVESDLKAKNTLLRVYRIQPLNPIAPFQLLLYDDFGLVRCRRQSWNLLAERMVPDNPEAFTGQWLIIADIFSLF